MVGVPGRSKGCNTCRRRRVKCDEAKPVCNRCTKAGFECLGYERQRLWRHTSTAPFAPGTEVGPVSLSSTEDLVVFSTSTTSPSRIVLPATTPPLSPSPQLLSPPREMSLVAFQGDFYYAFLFTNFVWKAYGSPWLEMAAEGRLGELSLDATRALAQANFGRANRQNEIGLQGAMLYGQCMRKLAVELGRGGTELTGNGGNGLLVPMLVFMMHAGALADRAGAISHMKGTARLLHMCGPEAFQQQPMINAFEAARSALLIAFLVSRQRLFLEDEKWLTVPWALNPSAKTSQSEVLDIMMPIPGILQDHADAENAEPQDPGLYSTILDKIRTQLVALYRWRWQWQFDHGSEVTVDRSSSSWPHSASRPAEALGSSGQARQYDRLRFSRVEAATEIMLYNSALMWLLTLCWKLAPLTAGSLIEECAELATPSMSPDSDLGLPNLGIVPNSPPRRRSSNRIGNSFEPLRRPGAALTVRDPAMEICRAFEWLSRYHGKGSGQTCLYLFPVGMAMSVLEREEQSRQWVRRLLDASPVTKNYSRGENVAGFGFYLSPGALDPGRVVGDEQQVYVMRETAVS